jgi:hypothetical protein
MTDHAHDLLLIESEGHVYRVSIYLMLRRRLYVWKQSWCTLRVLIRALGSKRIRPEAYFDASASSV